MQVANIHQKVAKMSVPSLKCLPARKSVSETVFAARKLPPEQRDGLLRFPHSSADCRILPRSLSFRRFAADSDFDFDLPSLARGRALDKTSVVSPDVLIGPIIRVHKSRVEAI